MDDARLRGVDVGHNHFEQSAPGICTDQQCRVVIKLTRPNGMSHRVPHVVIRDAVFPRSVPNLHTDNIDCHCASRNAAALPCGQPTGATPRRVWAPRWTRPKADGRTAHFYAVVTRDTVDQDFAAHRQRFLAEQGYAYSIPDAEDLLGTGTEAG